ncbi:hypothetical protein BN135_662 [Cronobacter muytjensii 530]
MAARGENTRSGMLYARLSTPGLHPWGKRTLLDKTAAPG